MELIKTDYIVSLQLALPTYYCMYTLRVRNLFQGNEENRCRLSFHSLLDPDKQHMQVVIANYIAMSPTTISTIVHYIINRFICICVAM